MELHQIRYFLALCEELNFTRAAAQCGIAQSSLTRAIKALEIELGGPLFHRERANTRLSRLGERVRPFLDQAQRHVDDAKRHAHDFMHAQTAMLRLGLMHTIAPVYLRDLVTSLHARHPDIPLQITEAGSTDLLQRLLAGELDAAIYASPVLAADDRLNHLPIYRELFVAVVRSAHRLARHDRVRLRDLADEPMIRRAGCEYVDALIAHHDLPVSFQSDRHDWVLAMAAAGPGYAVLPASAVDGAGVASLKLAEPEIVEEIALVTMRGRVEPAGLGALVREVMRIRWPGSAPASAARASVENDLETLASPR